MKNFNYAAVSGGRGVPCGLNTIKSLISCLAYNVICTHFLLFEVLKSVNSNFTLAVHSPKLGQAKTHCLSHFGEKREKIWLDQDLNPRSVDQKLIVLTITP